MTAYSHETTPACLWCGAPLPEPLEQTTRCGECGRGNRRDDLAVYHTLRPEARRLQTTLEVTAALVLGACFFASVVYWRHLKGGDPRVHWSILGPAILALVLGYQSRFLTRRRRRRRTSPSPLAIGGVLLAVAVYLTFVSLTQRDLEGTALYAVLAIAAIVVAAMVIRIWRAVAPSSS